MHGPTFRHAQYDAYKAGRAATPDDLRAQVPLMKKLLGEMGIAVCQCPRFEADDILGTFARIANEGGVDALLVTGDRDALQLIGPNTRVLMPKKTNETVEYDEALLMEQYGLTPARMPDLKGLMGDSSDNLPGIPGVGEKTARKLLDKYGTLENVLAHAGEEKGALQKKLLDGAESARMSYRMGIIDTHAPVQFGLEECAFEPARMAGGAPMMQELELRSLLSRLPKGEDVAPGRVALRSILKIPCRFLPTVQRNMMLCLAQRSLMQGLTKIRYIQRFGVHWKTRRLRSLCSMRSVFGISLHVLELSSPA